jgi:serine protease Do
MAISRLWRFCLPFLLALLIALPAQASENTELQPENIAKIGVARIRSGVLPGVVIGGRYDGILKILQERYTAAGRLDDRLEAASRQIVEDELLQAGYDITRSQSDEVFEEQLIEEAETARFLIGGRITQVSLNSYSSWFGDSTHDRRTIRWEVFDRNTGRIIYREQTPGEAVATGIDNVSATYEAIRASFRELLSEPDFAEALQRATEVTSNPTAPIANYEIHALASANQPLSAEQIARNSIPSIVWIHAPTGRGSGFFIDNSGLVVTNRHVVGDAFSVKVHLYDGSIHTGRVVKRDASDVALVKLEGEKTNVPGLPVCYTHAVQVGEDVIAIGNPLALSNTVTKGIISGIRSLGNRNLIQTDVAVNPGNSGGPLLNQQGVVVGIVTEKMTSRGVEGLGFALPIGESLQRLNVSVKSPTNAPTDRCGNPLPSIYPINS